MKRQLHSLTIISLLAGFLWATATCIPVPAQTTGSLHGTITDPTGAYIPNATVTLTQTESRFVQTTHSDESSVFSFASVPAGDYQLKIDAAGFRSSLIKSVVIVADQQTNLNIELALASTSETIEVYGSTGELEPFNSKTVTVGPLGDTPVLDLPYSVSTIPGNVIESQHVTTLEDLVKYEPSAQFEQRFGMNIGRLMTRGFEATVYQNVMVDGMYLSSTTQFPLQAYERVEVLNGLGGGLYGPANPSGTFNFILKRPTEERVETVGADYDEQGIRTFRSDFGGSSGPGKLFGYRINLLEGNGTSWVDWSRIRQNLESGAFDVHLPTRSLLEVNYFHSQYFQTGLPGSFSYTPSITLPAAPDPTKPGLGQPFAGLQVSTVLFLARLMHQLNQNYRFLAGVGSQVAPRQMWTIADTITSNAGAYTAKFSPGFNSATVRTAVFYFNGEQKTGPILNRLVLGARAFDYLGYAATSGPTCTPTATCNSLPLASGATIYNPSVSQTVPTITKQTATYKNGVGGQESLIFGDTASWKRWAASFTGSINWLFSRTYGANGQLTTPRSSAVYYETAFSPTTSLSYKPKDNMTAYFAYSTSVQNGDSTGTSATNPVNPNQYLPPITTTQYEAGYKAEFSKTEASLAFFRINRPFAYAANTSSPYEIQGNQVNRGLELNVKGKASHDLNILSGLTWLDPRMRDTVSAAANGKQYPGVSRVTANVLADYRLTSVRALRDLSVNANYHLLGKRAANEANGYWVGSTSMLDLGARYSHSFKHAVATARFGVMNATNQHYWASIMPGSAGGMNGATVGNASSTDTAFLGEPRLYNSSLLFTFH